MGWLILVAYVLGFVAFTRLAYPRVLDSETWNDQEPDGEDKALAGGLSFALAIFWPLVAVGAVLFIKPGKSKKQLAREKNRMQARIADLERELGVGR